MIKTWRDRANSAINSMTSLKSTEDKEKKEQFFADLMVELNEIKNLYFAGTWESQAEREKCKTMIIKLVETAKCLKPHKTPPQVPTVEQEAQRLAALLPTQDIVFNTETCPMPSFCPEVAHKVKEVIAKSKLFQLLNFQTSMEVVLIYGPPGTGKTKLARALVAEINGKQYNLTENNLFLKSTAQAVPLIFRDIELRTQSRQEGDPIVSTVLIDDFNEFNSNHFEGLCAQLCDSLERIQSGMMSLDKSYFTVVVLCSTFPWKLPASIRRRITSRIFLPLLRLEQVAELINLQLDQIEVPRKRFTKQELAELLDIQDHR